MTAPAVDTGLRILRDYADTDTLATAAAASLDKARVLLNVNSAPNFRLDHARLSGHEVFALRAALIAAAELARPA